MILMTMLARVVDGLPLAASIQDDEQADQNLVKYQSQAKMLFKKLTPLSPSQCSLESGTYIYHYLIEGGVCYLCLCDRNLPPKLAFAFLQDLYNEFSGNYSRRIDTVSRPYHFIEFDSYIQKAKRRYTDVRSQQNLGNIHNELHDVQKIMVQNIEDVIHRGESLNMLDTKAADLQILSKKYKDDAKYLNRRSTWMKIGLVVAVVVIFMLFVRFVWS